MSCRPPECGATCSSGARPPTGSTIGRTPSTSRRCTAARPKGTEPVAQPVAHPHGGDCTSLGTRLGGSGRLDTPRRVRPGHWARSHCLGFPSPPPPPSLTSPPPSHRLRPCRRYLLYNPHPTEEEQVAINAACLAVQLNLTASKLRCDRETEALALALALTTSPSPSPCLRLCPCPCPCPRPRPDPNPNPNLNPNPKPTPNQTHDSNISPNPNPTPTPTPSPNQALAHAEHALQLQPEHPKALYRSAQAHTQRSMARVARRLFLHTLLG